LVALTSPLCGYLLTPTARERGEQLVNTKAEAFGNLREGEQTGIWLNAKLIKLVKPMCQAARLSGLLLRPTPLCSQAA
jgi:hypothetical protein